MVRMEFTLDAFFADGGTTTFVDRLSSSLGIHASDVKIVSVYEGSLVVNYELTNDDDDEEVLEALAVSQDTLLTSDDAAATLGAPIMEHTSNVTIVAPIVEVSAWDAQGAPPRPDTSEADDDWGNSFITYSEDGTIDNEPEFQYIVEQNTPVVVVEEEPEVLVEEKKSPVVPIVISVVIIFALAFVVMYFMNKSKQGSNSQPQDMDLRISHSNDQESDGKPNIVNLGADLEKNKYDKAAGESQLVNSVMGPDA